MSHCAYNGPYSTAISAVERLAARCHFCLSLSARLASLTAPQSPQGRASGPIPWPQQSPCRVRGNRPAVAVTHAPRD